LIDRLPDWETAGPGVSRLLEIRVLSLLGFEPEVSACVRCRKPLDAIRRAAFSVIRGGVICDVCAPGERDLIPVGLPTLKLLARGLRADIDTLPRFSWSSGTPQEAARILHPFAQAQLGRELRTLKFMRSLSRESLR
jgi:DNA repair protein RecO (recombination protein O)